MQSDPTDDAAMALEDGPVDAPRSSIWRIDLAVAIILTGCTAFWGDLVGTGLRSHYYLASVLTSIAIVLPLALRRTHPLMMTALISAGGLAQLFLVPAPTWALIAVPIASYSVARWVDGHESRLIVLAGGVGSILGPVRWSVDDPIGSMSPELLPILAPLIALCLAWTITPYLLGRRDRETAVARQERELAAQERYESELVKRDQQTRMIEARVRTDIARELHDVVAHSLSVMIVQADGGKALARKRPEAAIQALETISETGREALGEMRRIVGVLRADPDDPQPADFQPALGLSDIPTMVAKAGERVQFSVTGTQPTVSAALGVTAYRIVQEGLTNFLKHGGPASQATVALIYQPTTISIEVANDAPGPDTHADGDPLISVQGSGFGLQGMQERVTAMGGRLTAKPTRSGGWVVRAILPLTSRAGTKALLDGEEWTKHQQNGEPT